MPAQAGIRALDRLRVGFVWSTCSVRDSNHFARPNGGHLRVEAA